MKIEIKKEHLEVAGVIAAVAGFVGVVIKAVVDAKAAKEMAESAFDQARRTNEAANKMVGSVDIAIDKVADRAIVDIPETIMNAAIERAAQAACERVAKECVREIKRDMRDRIFTSVDESVKTTQTKVEIEVYDEFKKRVNTINVTQFKNKVMADVERDLKSKVESSVDNVASAYTSQLQQQAALLKAVNEKLSVASA